ncbi:MAG: threonine aldolase family protein [Gemmatimonadaceae bacterium]|nr:threonine aldolase family protein [Gemmatimonadaceae bacterium]
MLDLRSDTVTQPSTGMRAAMAEATVGDDVLDGDPTTRALESRVAELLGTEAALYVPSGTMGNLIALCVHARPGTEVLLDAESHIVHWELAGAAAVAGVQVRPVRASDAVMSAADLAAAARGRGRYEVPAGVVCLENTHNGAGGRVSLPSALQAMADVAADLGIPVHLDGARLWNAHVATGLPLAAFVAPVDSVMVSFSKGLGAPVGAALAGSADFIARADRVRKRLGGGLRQSGVLAAAARYGLEHQLDTLAQDHALARALASALDGAGGARVVPPDTNIVMLDLPHAAADEVVAAVSAVGVRASVWSTTRVRFVLHRDIPADALTALVPGVAEAVARALVGAPTSG